MFSNTTMGDDVQLAKVDQNLYFFLSDLLWRFEHATPTNVGQALYHCAFNHIFIVPFYIAILCLLCLLNM